jgi:hypothetical protein
MSRIPEIIKRSCCLLMLLILTVSGALARQNAGALSGRIVDEQGAVVVGVKLTVVNSKGVERATTTNDQGNYFIEGLAAGIYTVRVAATGFAPYENTAVEIAIGRREVINIELTVATIKGEITVNQDSPSLSASPDKTANTIILKGKDLDALPDDPDDLANALQAMAGPSTGPNGGQLYVDGFASGSLPSKISIREIRINQNPIAAENDSPGIGRIDVFTQPGTDKFHGSAFFSFMDGRLNSRNPFSSNKLPFQRRQFGGTLSGRIIPNKLSFSVDFQRQDQGESQLISATILEGPDLNILPLRLSVLTPRQITSFSPRLDYQLNANHTLMARYSFSRTTNDNQGVGGFNLQSRAFNLSATQNIFRLTETSVLGPSVINETRFQYLYDRIDSAGDNSQPAIDVLQAFSGGGAQIGQSFDRADRWDLENNTTRAFRNHTMKFGGRLRAVRVLDVSENNFGGTFVYAGGVAPVLDANNQVVPGTVELITSIERFRRTQLLLQQGFSVDEILTRGGGASQFSINMGNARATVNQVDFGGFIQDDWRVRPNLTLSFGLRYENQTNISSNANVAPRLAFAWAPGGGNSTRPPMTVIRGGFGIFYERFSESLVLQTHRFNGSNQLQLIVSDPDFLSVPAAQSLELSARNSQIVKQVAEGFQSPYSLFTAVQVERQLPANITASALFFNAHTYNVWRQRNINAPLPGTFVAGDSTSGVRPFGDIGEIFAYESSGRQNESRLQIVLNGRVGPDVSLFASYNLAKAEGDAEGNFPADQYDLKGEFGPTSTDVRQRFVLGGSINLSKLKMTLNPLIIARSGFPFNIITGRDTNGDTLFTERPAFATDLTRPSVVETRFGNFDLNPLPGQQIIPRNFGRGPAFFTVNVGLTRAFGFDSFAGRKSRDSKTQAKGPAVLIQKSQKVAARESRYRFLLTVNCDNLFNRTNGAIPIGNLSSTLFGQSVSSAGPFGGGVLQSSNRRIRMQLRFEF